MGYQERKATVADYLKTSNNQEQNGPQHAPVIDSGDFVHSYFNLCARQRQRVQTCLQTLEIICRRYDLELESVKFVKRTGISKIDDKLFKRTYILDIEEGEQKKLA